MPDRVLRKRAHSSSTHVAYTLPLCFTCYISPSLLVKVFRAVLSAAHSGSDGAHRGNQDDGIVHAARARTEVLHVDKRHNLRDRDCDCEPGGGITIARGSVAGLEALLPGDGCSVLRRVKDGSIKEHSATVGPFTLLVADSEVALALGDSASMRRNRKQKLGCRTWQAQGL
eukprot:763629-Pleurochrysis_carterae.AAC.4